MEKKIFGNRISGTRYRISGSGNRISGNQIYGRIPAGYENLFTEYIRIRPDMENHIRSISSRKSWKISKKKFEKKIFSKKFRASCAQIVLRARQIVNRTRTKHEARSTKSDRPRHDRPRARNPIVYEARSSPPRQSWRVRRIRSVGSATESLFRGLLCLILLENKCSILL